MILLIALLLLLVAVARPLYRDLHDDGYGTRPAPRSHDERTPDPGGRGFVEQR